jgi:tRNA nucleotidyltransferase (CCA-adding enzyme)
VGGSVRDRLLGLAVQDHDWVVVGSTPEEMVAQGFQPVGRDFPVFLHPQTHEEYALARTERKTARGYQGFAVYAAPDVTLEQDLSRRDFTVNAMTMDLTRSDLPLFDPFGGRADLERRLLRAVTEGAFVDDPLRTLRGVRMVAELGFRIEGATFNLIRRDAHLLLSSQTT